MLFFLGWGQLSLLYFVFKKIRNVDAKSVIIETEEDELLQEETISVRKKSDKKGKKIRLVE